MTRFVIAAVLAAALAQAVGAQPAQSVPSPTIPLSPGALAPSTLSPGTVPFGTPLPPPPPPALYQPDVYVPPGASPGPAIPYHKTTGVVVGAYGFYPYDTGDWLLGGLEGITRSRGSFTMMYPSVSPPATGAPTGKSSPCQDSTGCKRGLFRR